MSVVRRTATLVNQTHARTRSHQGVEYREVNHPSNGAVEVLVENAELAVRFFVPPVVKIPIVDTQLTGSAASELRSHVAGPEVAVLETIEMDVVERHSSSVQKVPGGGFIVRVLH